MAMEVKNNHVHVTTHRTLNKFIEIHFFFRVYGLAVLLSIPRLAASKNIDEMESSSLKFGKNTFTSFKMAGLSIWEPIISFFCIVN